MKKIFWLVMLLSLLGVSHAQYTSVIATNITDAAGNRLTKGQLCFTATDANDALIPFQVGGGGQAVTKQVCVNVVNGLVANFRVANPALTSPSGILYRIQIYDSTGEILKYTRVQISGATFLFDSYIYSSSSVAPTGGVFSGPYDVTGTFQFEQYQDFKLIPTPSTNPSAGYLRVYGKQGSNLFCSLTQGGQELCGAGFYQTLAQGAAPLTQRNILNFAAGVTCVDNSGTASTDCTVNVPSVPVQSVFTRTGNVTAQAGDYTVGQVTGAEATANKDTASGYAGLDGSTRVKCAEFPALTGGVTSIGGTCATTLRALVSGDIPNNGANTTGSAGSLLGQISGTAGLSETASNVWSFLNSTTPQSILVYRTFTSGADFNALSMGWNAGSSQYEIGQTGTGATGGANQVAFRNSQGVKWILDVNGHWLANTDNANDIGASSANRPRSIYWGTQLLAPDGTASNPAFSYVGATNTGFRRQTGVSGGSLYVAAGTDAFQFDAAAIRVGGGVVCGGTGVSACDVGFQRRVANVSTIRDDGFSSNKGALGHIFTNDTSTGTSTNLLAKLNTSGQVVKPLTTDTSGVVGVCVNGCGTTSQSTVVAYGFTPCVFDGATTAGNYVQISTTTAGDCHDAGSTVPASGQLIGRVLSTNGAGGTFQVILQIREK